MIKFDSAFDPGLNYAKNDGNGNEHVTKKRFYEQNNSCARAL